MHNAKYLLVPRIPLRTGTKNAFCANLEVVLRWSQVFSLDGINPNFLRNFKSTGAEHNSPTSAAQQTAANLAQAHRRVNARVPPTLATHKGFQANRIPKGDLDPVNIDRPGHAWPVLFALRRQPSGRLARRTRKYAVDPAYSPS